MHRLLVDKEFLSEASPVLPADAAWHLKVLRPKDGEGIELFDGRGSWRVYKVAAAREGGGNFMLQASSKAFSAPRTGRELTLFACITKGSRWDWTVEKATELGVARIVPVVSERTIVRLPREDRPAKRERWMRIAEDAARQSDAKWLPEIIEAVDFKDALPMVRKTRCFVGALTDPPAMPLAKAIGRPPPSVAAFVGPEGDFTPDELAALLKIAVPTSFGPTILRAETAAIFAVSVLAAACDGERSEQST